MVTKSELLKHYAKKHDVDVELVNKIFEVERARLHPGEYEERHRQEDIQDEVVKWVKTHQTK
jgi:hypothetical protein